MATSNFLVVAAPDLVEECWNELQSQEGFLIDAQGRPACEPFVEKQKILGGIEVQCEPLIALQLNRTLKLASRVLWRKAKLTAREPYQLEAQLKKIPWSDWITPGVSLDFKIATSGSKMNNEKKIRQILEQRLKKDYRLITEEAQSTLFLRIHENEVTLSLDTSGEHLHRRGLRLRGEAPLRETLAAFAIRKMLEGTTALEQSQMNWWDPMSGSGSHLFEVAHFLSLSPRREFAYQHLKAVPRILDSEAFWKQHPLFPSARRGTLLADDSDEKAVKALRENFKALNLGEVEISQRDFFALSSREQIPCSESTPLAIVINPPYGERLAVDDRSSYFQKILDHAMKSFSPQRLGLWSPLSFRKCKWPENYKMEEWPLKNGGMPVYFARLTRN